MELKIKHKKRFEE